MADVQPLRGIRYAQEAIGDLSQVITPPFDIISREAQARYYARNPYNVIRLELGQEYPTDTALNNRYTRAAATFAEWRLKHILWQENTACFYIYQQIFTHSGKTYTRTSLLARVRLEPWDAKVVLPHELTHRKAKDDRLKLLRACAANFSPLMCMYDDPQGRVRGLLAHELDKSALAFGGPAINGDTCPPDKVPTVGRFDSSGLSEARRASGVGRTHSKVDLSPDCEAEVQITDEVNEKHLLYPITNAEQIALIQDFFTGRQLYVADGHHRYETALNYRNEVWEQRHELHPDDAINFVMMALIDVDDPGLLVLPTHRMLFDLSDDALHSLSSQRFRQYFTVRALAAAEMSPESVQQLLATVSEQHPSFVASTAQGSWLLSLNERGRQRMAGSGHPAAWNELDVAVAQMLVLEDLLRLSAEDMTAGRHVKYTDDTQEALQAVQSGKAQGALLFHATRVRQICEVAKAGDRMPQKSTYFYPKLSTGLVINPLW